MVPCKRVPGTLLLREMRGAGDAARQQKRGAAPVDRAPSDRPAVRRIRPPSPSRAARTAGCRRCGSTRPRPRYRRGRATLVLSTVPSARWITSSSSIRAFSCSTPSTSTISSPSRPSDLRSWPSQEGQRQHAHAHQVRAVDALEALGDHRLHAEQEGALRRPVAGGAGAVFLAAEDHQRHAFLLVAHRRVVDRRDVARGVVLGHAALDAGRHLVLDADVGEGAAHHDLVVAAARAVAVEVRLPAPGARAGSRRPG